MLTKRLRGRLPTRCLNLAVFFFRTPLIADPYARSRVAGCQPAIFPRKFRKPSYSEARDKKNDATPHRGAKHTQMGGALWSPRPITNRLTRTQATHWTAEEYCYARVTFSCPYSGKNLNKLGRALPYLLNKRGGKNHECTNYYNAPTWATRARWWTVEGTVAGQRAQE